MGRLVNDAVCMTDRQGVSEKFTRKIVDDLSRSAGAGNVRRLNCAVNWKKTG
jgi:hypothetical protein